ncbi:MAG: 50S ribosomal protein L29 [Patescibacteria group bacterium]|nr:50S ribosomal protein L29 [Patescibacteria group bacterium]
MNLKDKKAFQAKTTKELTTDLLKFKKDLIDQKLKIKTNTLKNTSILKKTRYQIALIKTLMGEKSRLRTLRSSSS